MKTVMRLLSYGRRYWPHLLASVFLMAVAKVIIQHVFISRLKISISLLYVVMW